MMVREVLRRGLREVEEGVRRLVERYLSGELGLEEYLEERVELELERERIAEENLRALCSGSTRRRGEPSQGSP